jgi:hypothetical protein
MSRLYIKPDSFRRDEEELSASKLEQILRAVMRQFKGGTGVDVNYFQDRIVINKAGKDSTLPRVENYLRQFVVLQVMADVLLCVPFTQEDDGNGNLKPHIYDPNYAQGTVGQMYVAKPYQLQQTPFNGKSVTLNNVSVSFQYNGVGARLAFGGGVSESQVIVPDYFQGDIVLACRATTGYITPNTNNTPVLWMDINSAARAWAVSS